MLMYYTLIGTTLLSPIVGTVMALLFLFRKHKHFAWSELGHHTLTKGLLLLAAWSTITAYVGGHWISLAASVVLWLYLGVVLYMQSESKSLHDFAKYGNWILFFGVLSAAAGFMQYVGLIGPGGFPIAPPWLGYVLGLKSFVPDPENRITATFGNANIAGAWFSVLAIMSTYYLYQVRTRWKKAVYLALIAIFVSSLLMTSSRGAIIALMCAMFVYFYFSFKHLRVALTVAFAAVVTMLFLYPSLLPRSDLLRESLLDRLTIWKICLRLFMQHPIEGVGLANTYFVDAIRFGYYRIAHAHNTVLAMFVELGTIGGAIFLWMHWSLAKYVFYLKKLNHRSVPVILALFSFFLVHGLVDYTLMSPQIGIIYIVLSGYVIRTWKEVSVERKKTEALHRRWHLEQARRAAKASGAM